jgi:hypothetical protein
MWVGHIDEEQVKIPSPYHFSRQFTEFSINIILWKKFGERPPYPSLKERGMWQPHQGREEKATVYKKKGNSGSI